MTQSEFDQAAVLLRRAAAAWFNDKQLTLLEYVLTEAEANVQRVSSPDPDQSRPRDGGNNGPQLVRHGE